MGTTSVLTWDKVMKNAVFGLFLVPLLPMPAFAGTLNVGDKPIVVAEDVDVRIGGVGVAVGEQHRHRDTTGLYMSDRDHHQIKNDHDRTNHRDHDRDHRDHDGDHH
jgi:hypothetical protein